MGQGNTETAFAGAMASGGLHAARLPPVSACYFTIIALSASLSWARAVSNGAARSRLSSMIRWQFNSSTIETTRPVVLRLSFDRVDSTVEFYQLCRVGRHRGRVAWPTHLVHAASSELQDGVPFCVLIRTRSQILKPWYARSVADGQRTLCDIFSEYALGDFDKGEALKFCPLSFFIPMFFCCVFHFCCLSYLALLFWYCCPHIDVSNR